MAAVLEKQSKRWTYEEYYRLNNDQRYEIIDGELLMAPAPDTWHQNWTLEIVAILREHINKLKLCWRAWNSISAESSELVIWPPAILRL